MKIKIFGICLILLVITVQSCGQENAGDLYNKYNEAYSTLDYFLLESLYEDDAFSLAGEGKILRGKQNFLAPIKEMFDDAKEKNLQINIGFMIVQRDYFDGAFADVGYSKLDLMDDQNNVVSRSVRKFVTVARRQSDGSLKFRMESFTEAPEEGFFGN